MSGLRRRNVAGDESPRTPSSLLSPTVRRNFKKLDLYPKLVEEERLKTSAGGIVSTISLSIIGILFLSEFSRYFSSATEEHLMVDPHIGEKLQIDFDITFHALHCAEVNLDAMDVVGDQQNGLVHDISKIRMDPHGNAIGSAFAHSLDADDSSPDHHAKDGCGSCYGAESEQFKCCNTCEDVKQAYLAKGWNSAQVLSTAEQCASEREARGLVSKKGEGCRIYGFMQVNKVAGNFHVAMGETHSRDQRHIHQFNPQQIPHYNVSHTINKLEFGPSYKGITNPLNGVTHSPTGSTGVYQYFLKLVPTHVDGTFRTLKTHQFSYTLQFRAAMSHGIRHNILPGVFIIYDFSPFMVKVKNASTSLLDFLTSICAIIGGVFAVSGIIASAVHFVMERIHKKTVNYPLY